MSSKHCTFKVLLLQGPWQTALLHNPDEYGELRWSYSNENWKTLCSRNGNCPVNASWVCASQQLCRSTAQRGSTAALSSHQLPRLIARALCRPLSLCGLENPRDNLQAVHRWGNPWSLRCQSREFGEWWQRSFFLPGGVNPLHAGTPGGGSGQAGLEKIWEAAISTLSSLNRNITAPRDHCSKCLKMGFPKAGTPKDCLTQLQGNPEEGTILTWLSCSTEFPFPGLWGC